MQMKIVWWLGTRQASFKTKSYEKDIRGNRTKFSNVCL